jgi:hypothetical protein
MFDILVEIPMIMKGRISSPKENEHPHPPKSNSYIIENKFSYIQVSFVEFSILVYWSTLSVLDRNI